MDLFGPDRVFCSDDCIFKWCIEHNVRDEDGNPLDALIDRKTGKRIDNPYI
jgi:hypothetical protein